MPAPLPPTVSPGDSITAEHHNLMVGAIAARTVIGGRGIKTSSTPDGVVVALAEPPIEYRVGARIGAVYGNDGDPVDTIRYDAQALGAEGVSLVNVTPKYGRLFADTVAAKPAAVGDFCFIVRMPRAPQDGGGFSAELWVVSEQYYVVRCVSSGGTGGSGARRPFNGPGGTPPTVLPPPPPPGGDGTVIVDSGRDPGGFGEF